MTMGSTGILSANRNGNGTWSFAAVALSMAALYNPSAWAQAPYDGCPALDKPAQIEVLPVPPLAKTFTGNTCALHNKTLTKYSSCNLRGVDYPEPEAVYKVWLHERNNVKFDLSMDKGVDLALVLLQPCNEASCSRSSDSTTKGAPENLSMKSYPPG